MHRPNAINAYNVNASAKTMVNFIVGALTMYMPLTNANTICAIAVIMAIVLPPPFLYLMHYKKGNVCDLLKINININFIFSVYTFYKIFVSIDVSNNI